jgi:hypothetical protein
VVTIAFRSAPFGFSAKWAIWPLLPIFTNPKSDARLESTPLVLDGIQMQKKKKKTEEKTFSFYHSLSRRNLCVSIQRKNDNHYMIKVNQLIQYGLKDEMIKRRRLNRPVTHC